MTHFKLNRGEVQDMCELNDNTGHYVVQPNVLQFNIKCEAKVFTRLYLATLLCISTYTSNWLLWFSHYIPSY